MPCICEFDGIQIYMYVPDHNPPHFHARVRGIEAQITIDDVKVLMNLINHGLDATDFAAFQTQLGKHLPATEREDNLPDTPSPLATQS